MRKLGHRWTQATVWAIEKGERSLKLAEAVSLAQVLGLSQYEAAFMGDPDGARIDLSRAARLLFTVQRDAERAVRAYMRRRLGLAADLLNISDETLLSANISVATKSQLTRALAPEADPELIVSRVIEDWISAPLEYWESWDEGSPDLRRLMEEQVSNRLDLIEQARNRLAELWSGDGEHQETP